MKKEKRKFIKPMHHGHIIQLVGIPTIILNGLYWEFNGFVVWVLVGLIPFIYSTAVTSYQAKKRLEKIKWNQEIMNHE